MHSISFCVYTFIIIYASIVLKRRTWFVLLIILILKQANYLYYIDLLLWQPIHAHINILHLHSYHSSVILNTSFHVAKSDRQHKKFNC